jgi:hypothetical protein
VEKNMSECKRHPYSDYVSVEGYDGLVNAVCRKCVEGFGGNMGIEVDLKVWSPEEKMKQRTLFNRWFSSLLDGPGSCLLRDVLRNQKENLWSEWQKVRPFEDGGE